jgi:phenylacetate-coenzyme A ligase PaaK-like adenylate-forming protein
MADYERLRERHLAEFSALVPEHLERLRWPVDRIREERERRLRVLLAAARERSSWHAGRLAAVDPATATEADLARIPPMTKDDMMEHLDGIFTDPRLSRRLVEVHVDTLVDDAYLLDEFHVFTSGGSSGRRGVFVYDWNGWMWFSLSLLRFAIRQRRADPELGPEAVEAVVAAEKASHMSGATTFSPPGAPIHRFPSTLPLATIVAGLNRVQPAILRGYPTALCALAAEARAGRLRIAPRAVRAQSEPLLPEARSAIEETWGRPVGNGYGTTEGAAASSCGEGRGMHLNEDLCIFELVDEAGKPVPPGERCTKLYVTNLSNLAQPLIRYDLTDELRILDEPCPCGSAFRRVDDIEGRNDDLFTYPGGVVVHPLVFRSPLGRERHVVEYQVHQTPRGVATRLRADGEVDVAALSQRIADALAHADVKEPQVTVTRVEAFERQATGKLKRFFPLAAR